MPNDYDLSNEDTYDIQHDLAMMLADGFNDEDTEAYKNELIKRGAAIPSNCQWHFSSYHLGHRKLSYNL